MIDPGRTNTPVEMATLKVLLSATTPLTTDILANRIKVEPKALQSAVELLCQTGCVIDEHPQQGLLLVEAGLGVWSDYLAYVSHRPRSVMVYQQLTSTQDACRRRVGRSGPVPEGDLVVADEQTAGRGRLGRRWEAAAGSSVLFSMIHCDRTQTKPQTLIGQLSVAISVALAEALEPLLPSDQGPIQIKWPNDLYINGQKLAGILVETVNTASKIRAAIIGVGINIHQEAAQLPPATCPDATSLSLCGARTHRLHVLAKTLEAIDRALQQNDPHLLERWRSRSAILNQRTRLQSDGKIVAGQVLDLDPQWGLIIRTDSGTMAHLPAQTTTVI